MLVDPKLYWAMAFASVTMDPLAEVDLDTIQTNGELDREFVRQSISIWPSFQADTLEALDDLLEKSEHPWYADDDTLQSIRSALGISLRIVDGESRKISFMHPGRKEDIILIYGHAAISEHVTDIFAIRILIPKMPITSSQARTGLDFGEAFVYDRVARSWRSKNMEP